MSIDNKGNSNKNISTTSRISQQHTLKTSIKKTKTKEGRRPSQDETILTFHPKQALWNGERTKLRSYIQQWHTQLKGFSDMKAITSLQKCLPLPYIDFIQGSSTLLECLQILEKFCARETLKSKISPTETGNTNNSHRKNSKIQ